MRQEEGFGLSGQSSGWVQTGTWTPAPSAGPPAIVSLTPSSGTGQSVVFSAVYSDPNGAADLNEALLLVNTSVNSAAACYVYYHPQSNQLYLENDAGTAWLTPALTPGGSGTLANSQCTLNASSSTISTSGNNLTLKVSLTFASTVVGPRNVYLEGFGLSGQSSGWVQTGTWTPAPSAGPPTIGSLTCSPSSLSSGSASTCTITLNQAAPASTAVTVSDNNASLTVPASVTVASGATSASFTATAGTISTTQTVVVTATLGSSTQTASLTLLPPLALASLQCSPSSLSSGASTTCTVTLNQSAPTGGSAVALSSNNTALTVPASVTVPANSIATTFTATVGTITTTQSATITATLNGTLNTTVTLTSTLLTPTGLTASAGNLVVSLNWTASSGATSYNIYRGTSAGGESTTAVKTGITGTTFTDTGLSNGTTYFYKVAAVNAGGTSGPSNEASATPASAGPPAIVSLTPSSGTGQSVVFSAVYSDPNGAADLNEALLLVNTSVNGATACYVYYRPQSNQLYLENDAGTAWLTATLTPGGSGTLANSQCTLNASSSTISTSGNNLTLEVSLTFASTVVGPRNVYLEGFGLSGQSSGWVQTGTWTP